MGLIVKLKLTPLTKNEGGRATPIYDQPNYKPHLVIEKFTCESEQYKSIVNNPSKYLGVVFLGNNRQLKLNIENEVTVGLLYPEVNYSELKKGSPITVREGNHIVAFGTVVSNILYSIKRIKRDIQNIDKYFTEY